ncbi:hypothetical protein SDJN03_25153, partial [Cucurbita argyrosperma subsp. sororia]
MCCTGGAATNAGRRHWNVNGLVRRGVGTRVGEWSMPVGESCRFQMVPVAGFRWSMLERVTGLIAMGNLGFQRVGRRFDRDGKLRVSESWKTI